MSKPNLSIKELKVDKNKGILCWKYKDKLIEIDYPKIDQALVTEKQKAIVTLSIDNKLPNLLVAFRFNGDEIFKITPPENFNFYYLSHHSKADITVVCITSAPIEGWTDWHFAVDIKNKKISRFCPAY